jgi:hypothetical protein
MKESDFMKLSKRLVASVLVPAAFAAVLGAPARASVIDFVAEAGHWAAAVSGENGSEAKRTIDGIEVSLLATRVRSNGDIDRRSLSFFEDDNQPLVADGVGIVDDEITRAPDGNGFSTEVLTISFSQRVRVTGFDFLDLFVDTFHKATNNTPMDEREKETAQVDFHDGMAARLFEAVQLRGTGPGSLQAAFPGVVTDRLTFSVFSNGATFLGPTDDSQPDYALGAVRFEEVAPVPLPAAGWMLIAAIGGLWGLRRRRAAAAT